MGDGLGPNSSVCVDAFVEAMRNTLPDEQKGKLDRPEVRAGLEPLGAAVYDIAIGPAQTRADNGTDEAFWSWLEDVTNWMAEMEAWRAGVVAAFARIAPPVGPLRTLAEAVQAAPQPPPPPPSVPGSMTGEIR